jgi:SAM-dependent methyltransferase
MQAREATMKDARPPENEQHALWNGPAAQAWIDTRDLLDATLRPFEDLLVEAVLASGGGHVLDVGCGTGSTTLAIARRIGQAGRAIGLDISDPMIAVARDRAANEGSAAALIAADAESHRFEPPRFDAIVSRFGVMFFADPVRAFANLRLAARKDAALTCIVWRSAGENPFMTTAEHAAAPLLANIPPRRTDGPGQFAWADDGKVARILGDSGWSGIAIEPLDVTCAFPQSELDRYVTRLGPLGPIFREAEEPTRGRVIDTVRTAFAPFVHGDEVRFTAACWRVRATA